MRPYLPYDNVILLGLSILNATEFALALFGNIVKFIRLKL